MAKSKNVNPADAYRKAQRKKELRKNKADRTKKRDFALVKKDTFDLEDEITNLEALPTPSSAEKTRLTEAKAELEKINQKKEEYVKEHPEHRRLVYRPRKQQSVVMPEGPPPKPEDAVDSDDDIPMPKGPPPGQKLVEEGTSDQVPVNPPLPPMPPPPMLLNNFGPPLPFPPFPPTGFPGYMVPPVVPPPPSNFALPPPPPGFFPRRQQSTTALQDPLSSIPHQTFQDHRAQVLAPPHPSLPQKPRPEGSSFVIVSAEPQLRDLKKEATSFVPTSLKRKKAAGASASRRINAAPGVGDVVEGEISARPDLLSALKGQFGPAPTDPNPNPNPPAASSSKEKSTATKTKDDYEKFVEEMGDILGP
ncbi:uncharacterized protein BT62DRAFT_926409 [Guyanagaster necrorhizus]|uniref:Wbp11/ELF5/Saf1 N-terminal domain-containing protein n=1 Tax=Guyanagaster necrorhizus TaxID=856835 RepID=A0A9P7W4X0_9AGAR|nr:uncharacterized protein BT62DRAFT_926409 [Guyanagaster necrorhizus MCA 3950]KAG7452198.1 hypothetical protein BT62DRAFT_926409 [Guyanagaster necrorhizus MCA 3950]